ncbi:MAG: hypothetical protein WAU12_16910, partial [Saprospiraceae bacterium]
LDNISGICLMSDDLKRFAPSLNEEKIIFESIEGNLEHSSDLKLKSWVTSDPILKQHYDAMLATRTITGNTLTYPHKSNLKRREPVVKYLYMLIAACLIGLLFMFNPFLKRSDDGLLVKNDKIREIKVVNNESKNHAEANQVEVAQTNESTILPPKEASEVTSQRDLFEYNRKYVDVNNQHISQLSKIDVVKFQNFEKINTTKDPILIQNEEVIVRNEVASLPRIARLGSERVMSIEPKLTFFNMYQTKRLPEEDVLLAGAVNSIKQKIDFLDRKSAAIYGFADYQKNIIKSEGLFEVSKDRTPEGKIEGYSLRIAGFELSTAR